MERKDIKKTFSDQIENDLGYFMRNMESALKKKIQYEEALDNGLLDPIQEYYSFAGSQLYNIHFLLPLDKPLFFKKVAEMKELGWKESGAMSLSNNFVSQTMDYGDYPDQISIYIQATGEGVNCRLIKLDEGQSWKSPVYEWVCEEGAKEMENGANS